MNDDSFVIRNLGKLIAVLAIVGFSIAIIIASFYFLNFNGDILIDSSAWGQFGDYFGGILNPTFSFIALIALLFNLYIQRYEIKQFHVNKKTEKLEELLSYSFEFMKIADEDIKKLGRPEFHSTLSFNMAPTCQLKIDMLSTLYFPELKVDVIKFIIKYKDLQNEIMKSNAMAQEAIHSQSQIERDENIAKMQLINLEVVNRYQDFTSALEPIKEKARQLSLITNWYLILISCLTFASSGTSTQPIVVYLLMVLR